MKKNQYQYWASRKAVAEKKRAEKVDEWCTLGMRGEVACNVDFWPFSPQPQNVYVYHAMFRKEKLQTGSEDKRSTHTMQGGERIRFGDFWELDRFKFLQSHKGKEEWRILEIPVRIHGGGNHEVYLGGLVPVLFCQIRSRMLYPASACMAGISVQTTPSWPTHSFVIVPNKCCNLFIHGTCR